MVGWGQLWKWLLYFFNLLVVIVGILDIILGSLILNALGDVTSINHNTEIVPILIIVLGVLLLIVPAIAGYGGAKDNNCIVLVYISIILILCELQAGIAVYLIWKKSNFLTTMDTMVSDAFDNSNNGTDSSAMNIFQITFSCCGYNSYLDYANTTVPASCCGFTDTTASCPSSVYSYELGCKDAYYDFWIDNLGYVIYGGLVAAFVEFLALASAGGLWKWTRNAAKSTRADLN